MPVVAVVNIVDGEADICPVCVLKYHICNHVANIVTCLIQVTGLSKKRCSCGSYRSLKDTFMLNLVLSSSLHIW